MALCQSPSFIHNTNDEFYAMNTPVEMLKTIISIKKGIVDFGDYKFSIFCKSEIVSSDNSFLFLVNGIFAT